MTSYLISSFSTYKNKEAIATAGNTKPTNGTKMLGKNCALIRFYKLLCLTKTNFWLVLPIPLLNRDKQFQIMEFVLKKQSFLRGTVWPYYLKETNLNLTYEIVINWTKIISRNDNKNQTRIRFACGRQLLYLRENHQHDFHEFF